MKDLMALYMVGVSIAGGTISLVSFVGLCNSILMLRDSDPDKQRKSRRILIWCLLCLVIGVTILRNPDWFHPDHLQALIRGLGMVG
ncbi:hypothetical protein [Aestuariispira insulae]|uniref:Uncharacterized protein n=1 Tax=Aestuariispira insulae TaxID=1461337 RepID=A0A3D9HK72_9PROT|nr:hypothetical protein [Aestuariispira insulae]RED49912.1 hypothetical protein DFP90_105285 [Aestuariispira insulae]